MLTPQQIESLADAVIDAYQDMDTAMRVAAARAFDSSGVDLDRQRVIRAIQQAGSPRAIEDAIISTYTQAGLAGKAADDRIYAAARAAGLLSDVATDVDDLMLRNVLTDGITRAVQAHNLVATTASNAVASSFTNALDRAMLSIATGAASHDEAIAAAINTIARDTTRVTYVSASGVVRSDTLYTAVRRSVVTGVNQMAARITESRFDRYGVEYVEITAHAGARPEHAEWQGQVVRYADLPDVTGYGEVDGLAGAGCRHGFAPFFPGVNEPTDYGDLDALDNDEEYALSQRQRLCERNIRTYRSREDIFIAGGQDDAAGRMRGLREKWAAENRRVSAARRDFPRVDRMVPFPGEARW